MMFDPRIRFFKLEGHEVVRVEYVDFQQGVMTWAASMTTDRVVGRDKVGDVEVSTVFLGFDHGRGDVPLLFETMIFAPDADVIFGRYPTWEAAERGHQAALDKMRAYFSRRFGGEAGNLPPPPPPPDRG